MHLLAKERKGGNGLMVLELSMQFKLCVEISWSFRLFMNRIGHTGICICVICISFDHYIKRRSTVGEKKK